MSTSLRHICRKHHHRPAFNHAAGALGEGFVRHSVFRFAIETPRSGQAISLSLPLPLFFPDTRSLTRTGSSRRRVGADHLGDPGTWYGTEASLMMVERRWPTCISSCRWVPIVDDDSLRLRRRDAEALRLQRAVDAVRQKRGSRKIADKARPGDQPCWQCR